MQVEVRISHNQSLLDIAIQEYGTIQAAFDLALANGLEVTDQLTPGMTLELPVSEYEDRDVAQYFKSRKIHPATGVFEMPEDVIGTNYSDENYVEQNYWL